MRQMILSLLQLFSCIIEGKLFTDGFLLSCSPVAVYTNNYIIHQEALSNMKNYLNLIFALQHSLHYQAKVKKREYSPNTYSTEDPIGENQEMT